MPLLGLLTALGVLTGCQWAGPAQRDAERLSPVLQRMQRTYDDLAGGRFISLADFESPGQVDLFRVTGPEGEHEGHEQPALSVLRSRSETGAGSLRADLRPHETLWFDGRRSTDLALVSNWQSYAVLLMSLHGPDAGVTLRLTVHSGRGGGLTWSRDIRVEAGWNLVRIDLATVADFVDLADVRALTWTAVPGDRAVEFHLDDVIVADNTRVALRPEPLDDTFGTLYAFHRGLRIYVGAPGRFELSFYEGLITSWRRSTVPVGAELADLRPAVGDLVGNLTDPAGLGPRPVRLAAGAAPSAATLFAALPQAAFSAEQRLVEVSSFRAVLEASRRESAGGPELALRYVVYPTGEIHVHLRQPAQAGAPEQTGLLVVLLNNRRGFRHVPPPPAGTAADAERFVLLSQPARGEADLLWTWPSGRDAGRTSVYASPDERRLAAVIDPGASDGGLDAVQMIRVWPADMDGAPEANELAADFRRPAALRPTAGRVRTTQPGDVDEDGYNEAQGCYELEPAGGVLRLTFDPAAHLRFDPVLRVHETAGRRCWAYIRGRTADVLGRDAEGNLLVHVGALVSAPALVEVHVAAEPQPTAGQ